MKRFLMGLILCCAIELPLSAQETWTIQWEGLSRSSLVDFPPSRTGQTGLPVVFALHGYGGTGTDLRNLQLKLQLLGDSVGFITVHPEGYNDRWNSGIGDNPNWPTPSVDDVGFISKIIDSLISRFSIDTLRIYSCGLSNGGFMSMKLAARLSNRIAAVASVAGVLTNSTAAGYSAVRPVPLLIIHGTADTWVPYNGGVVGWYSVMETIEFWTTKNGCSLLPDSLGLPDLDPNDQSTVMKYTYRGSSSSSIVELLKVNGGGHTWPGMYWVTSQFGPTNRDISANNEIWNFFKGYTTDIAEGRSTYPTMFWLSQNYPNPFNPSTMIRYGLPNRSHVTLSVFNTLGQQVASLVNGEQEAGYHEVRFNGSALASGMYFFRIQAGSFVQTKKMLVVK